MFTAPEIQRLIEAALPDAEVRVWETVGDGEHFEAEVIAEAFRGQPRVRQHQQVYAALGSKMGHEIHALKLTTRPPGDG